ARLRHAPKAFDLTRCPLFSVQRRGLDHPWLASWIARSGRAYLLVFFKKRACLTLPIQRHQRTPQMKLNIRIGLVDHECPAKDFFRIGGPGKRQIDHTKQIESTKGIRRDLEGGLEVSSGFFVVALPL